MKKRFSNNKGFSLVELIIVVAIMAILIGILAPQYMKFVEKSRVSADVDTIDELKKSAETAVADPDTKIAADFKISITGGTQGAKVTGDNAASTEISALTDLATANLKSKTYKTKTVDIEVKFEKDPNNAAIQIPKVTVTDPTGAYKSKTTTTTNP